MAAWSETQILHFVQDDKKSEVNLAFSHLSENALDPGAAVFMGAGAEIDVRDVLVGAG
jgi:hypothetical protein